VRDTLFSEGEEHNFLKGSQATSARPSDRNKSEGHVNNI
jgi:hypothetical protein